MFQVYMRFNGMDFGSYADNSKSKFSVSIFNPKDNNKKKNYCYKYLQRLVTRIDFQFQFANPQYETVVVQIHKHGLFGKDLIAETTIPLYSFPTNFRCSERITLKSKKDFQVPIHILMDVHVSDGLYNPFYAPPGKSQIEQFNPDLYKSFENKNNNALYARETANSRLI